MQRLLTIFLILLIGTASANSGWCQIYAEIGRTAGQMNVEGDDCCALNADDHGSSDQASEQMTTPMHCHRAIDETFACTCENPQSSNPASSPVASIQPNVALQSDSLSHSFLIGFHSQLHQRTPANHHLQNNKSYLNHGCLRI